MKKKGKLIVAIICVVLTFACINAVDSDPVMAVGNAILGTILAVIATVLFYGIIAAKRGVKKADADQYYNETKEKADLFYQERTSAAEKAKEEADLYYQEQVKAAEKKRSEIENEINSLNLTLNERLTESMVESVDVDAYSNLRSDEVKNELALLKVREDDLIKSGLAYTSTIDGRKISEVNTQAKQLLRCFNAESSSIIEGVTAKNADSARGKIRRSYEALNKLFAKDRVEISEAYLSMKFEELSLVYAYMLKLEEEKEQKKAIREQMVEEEKVRREIERQKAKIEKEESQFSNEVKKLMGYMQNAKDDVEKQLYIDKIKELEDKLKALAADKEDVLHREQNTRAGFVYIISNIGSFGEQVYKIGMTRRLEPMERIDELSSASVPFKFDVHAMIFSDDAPALEAILHQTFRDNQVNKVNPRKEFFKVDLEEIKKIVRENHNATVHFIDVPDAEEYRETLRIEAQSEVTAI